MISLIVPTFNESASIEITLRRAAAAIHSSGEQFEIIVVDDASPDGTAGIVQRLSGVLPVRLLQRSGRNGLASAVVAGWQIAQGDLLAVMDADLQHPPEILTSLVAAIRSGADIAVASRTGEGGGSKNWSWVRQFTSWTAKHLASCVLPLTLASIHDSMSGMFMFKASILQGVTLQPMGYKILLEVLAKANYRSAVEVPYMFCPRASGSSKLGTLQMWEYILHLVQLAVATGQFKTWLCYAMVGFTGASIHLAVLMYLVLAQHVPLVMALVITIQFALLNNFVLNRFFTFRRLSRSGFANSKEFIAGFMRYQTVCLPGAGLNILLTLLLIWCNHSLLTATLAGIVLGGIWNCLFNVPSIWRSAMPNTGVSPLAAVPCSRATAS